MKDFIEKYVDSMMKKKTNYFIRQFIIELIKNSNNGHVQSAWDEAHKILSGCVNAETEVNVYYKPIAEIDLSIRSYNCLRAANILYIGDLVQKSESDMMRLTNFGRRSLNEIRAVLDQMGLGFGMNLSPHEYCSPISKEKLSTECETSVPSILELQSKYYKENWSSDTVSGTLRKFVAQRLHRGERRFTFKHLYLFIKDHEYFKNKDNIKLTISNSIQSWRRYGYISKSRDKPFAWNVEKASFFLRVFDDKERQEREEKNDA